MNVGSLPQTLTDRSQLITYQALAPTGSTTAWVIAWREGLMRTVVQWQNSGARHKKGPGMRVRFLPGRLKPSRELRLLVKARPYWQAGAVVNRRTATTKTSEPQ